MEPLSSIQPLQRLTLFDALADQIEEWILSGQLEAGAKLPSEEALRRQFGVSRPVVREALGRLRERGLIETVSGSGTFVRHPDADHLTDALVRHLRVAGGGLDSIKKVYEARITIETRTAFYAALRATQPEIEQIQSLVAEMNEYRRDVERWTAADLGFHLAIARASHNPFLATLLTPLVKVIERGIIESFDNRAAVAAGLQAHERIAAAIAASEGEIAEEAMRAHLHDSELRLSDVRSRRAR